MNAFNRSRTGGSGEKRLICKLNISRIGIGCRRWGIRREGRMGRSDGEEFYGDRRRLWRCGVRGLMPGGSPEMRAGQVKAKE